MRMMMNLACISALLAAGLGCYGSDDGDSDGPPGAGGTAGSAGKGGAAGKGGSAGSGGSSGKGGDGSGGTTSGGTTSGGTTSGGTTSGGSAGTGTGGTGPDCGSVVVGLSAADGQDPSTFCVDYCNWAWVSIFDPQGQEIGPPRMQECTPYNVTLDYPAYYGFSAFAFDTGQCLSPGTYTAKMCARPGTPVSFNDSASGPGFRLQDSPPEPPSCSPTGDPICVEVSFELPGDSEVTGQVSH